MQPMLDCTTISIVLYDYSAARRSDVFNIAQRLVSPIYTCALCVDGTVVWVEADHGLRFASSTAIQRMGITGKSYTLDPLQLDWDAYLQVAHQISHHRANRWWMLLAVLGRTQSHNCTSLASSILGKRYVWPQHLQQYLETHF